MSSIDHNIQLAASGDLAAFEQVYLQNHRRVYSLCFRMTRNVSEAEDLTQDVFLQVFRKLKTFRGDSSFSTWLHRITLNAVLMSFRKSAVRKEQTTEDGTLPVSIVVGTQHPGRMSVIDHISLNEAIRKLSPGYRAVFMLHDIGGYEHTQIATFLGCKVGTSKSQLHKARIKLRQLLTNGARSVRRRRKSQKRLQRLKLQHQGTG